MQPKSSLSSDSKSSYIWATITGLLSSSCCIIQLILNFFSIGCAGFSVLTPYRPIFLSFTAILIIYTITKYGISSKRTLITLLISISLTASPELISLHNQGKIISSTNSKEILVREIETFVVEINGISCEGCANRIKAQFDSKPFVIDSKVYFKNQSAIVSVKSGTYNSNDIETWVKMVDFKYGAKVIQQYIKTVEEE
ncbi:4723_t:CDS:1 [Funneliformis mosseae]|uniref:4723_t:CDS:1 n=1 Tax=Funneliformis mosseae TaxID=27381 RepID=A0A9N8ZM69_FUNMO|nr:4723_t:CDS:1 [Funneliformis mosseae]